MKADPAGNPHQNSVSVAHFARVETETSEFADDLDYVVQLSTKREQDTEVPEEGTIEILEMQNRDPESGDVQKAA